MLGIENENFEKFAGYENFEKFASYENFVKGLSGALEADCRSRGLEGQLDHYSQLEAGRR